MTDHGGAAAASDGSASASQRPSCFFILGYGRSGTTLVRRMLSAHPGLFVPPENDIFQRLPRRIGKGLADADAVRAMRQALPIYYGKIYDLDLLERLLIDKLPLSTAEVIATFFAAAHIGADKPGAIWGHKLPSEWPYVSTWRRWYPEAKHLHVVRHPLDSTASMIQHQLQRYPTTPLVGIWQWRKAFRSIRRQGAEMDPERYHMIRYEDLVADPEPVLAGVSRFLGVSADHVPAMIDYAADTRTNTQVDRGAHMAQTNAPLTTARIGRNDFGPELAARMSYLCRKELAELGYEPRGGDAPGAAGRLASGAACAGLDVAWAGLRAARRLRGEL
jgi:LPS sulfotransferase NodH